MEKNALGVRKGAWTKEEDILLRKCIEKYGEGRWHLVPNRAELNRCRKSCRLRWLNYLRPNIKRGYFTKDEVDLIVRLHKLLGNRWSLIAGRIPGRTANDVKNFWNTNINKKSSSARPAGGGGGGGESCHPRKAVINIANTNVIRPRPRTFYRELPCPNESTFVTSKTNDHDKYVPTTNNNQQPSNKSLLWGNKNSTEEEEEEEDDDDDECMRWWDHLLKTTENENGEPLSFPEDGMGGPAVSGNPGVHRAIDDDYGLSGLDLDIVSMLGSL